MSGVFSHTLEQRDRGQVRVHVHAPLFARHDRRASGERPAHALRVALVPVTVVLQVARLRGAAGIQRDPVPREAVRRVQARLAAATRIVRLQYLDGP
eukprot:gene7040-biopygen11409